MARRRRRTSLKSHGGCKVPETVPFVLWKVLAVCYAYCSLTIISVGKGYVGGVSVFGLVCALRCWLNWIRVMVWREVWCWAVIWFWFIWYGLALA